MALGPMLALLEIAILLETSGSAKVGVSDRALPEYSLNSRSGSMARGPESGLADH